MADIIGICFVHIIIQELDSMTPSPVSPSPRSTRQPVQAFLLYLILITSAFVVLSIQILSQASGSVSPGHLLFPFGVGLIHLGCAGWVLFIRRKGSVMPVLAVLLASVGMGVAGLPLRTAVFIHPVWIVAMGAAGAGFFDLGMILPAAVALVRKWSWLRALPWLAAVLLASLTVIFPSLSSRLEPLLMAFAGAGLLFYLFMLSIRRTAGVERDQVRLMFWSSLLAFTPLALWLVASRLVPINIPYDYFLLPLMVFPVAAAYYVQHIHHLRTETIVTRSVIYSVLGILTVGGYALLVSGLGIALAGFLPLDSPWIPGIAFFILALLFHPLRKWLQTMVDRLFFRGGQAYQDLLKTFSGDLTGAIDLQTIVDTLRQYLERSLQPEHLHIFLHDPLSDLYSAALDSTGRPTSDLRFSPGGALVEVLHKERSVLVLENLRELPATLRAEESRLRLLDSSIFIPLHGRQRLLGWISLGNHRQTGESYTTQEISFLESLSHQAVLAIERAQVVNTMQRRMQEVNLLSRVAQGVNININMDDIYELTYAQVMKVIPADDVRLMLLDASGRQLVQVFMVRRDERLYDQENVVIPPGNALEQEVIRQRKAICTDDYNREVQRRGLLLPAHPVFAWLSVPLNSGAKTIGALSLGSDQPGLVYTPEQLNLLQSVADQLGGAIEKSHLLEETERRARQLSKLNEITRRLTSTLEIEPLLKTIMRDAVEMLDCEAGSLIMVDQPTGELVFRVVEGNAAGQLAGVRMPPGSGLAGRVVRTREPLIIDDVTQNPEWFSQNDHQTGFITRTVLVVPLLVKENVTGVVEVINPRNGSLFTDDDRDLLVAFAAQAAIALENARLYTLTDQALAERVEELSVMQRIDRELNASLEPARAMHITLKWAMKQSNAGAGLIGLLEGGSLKIMDAQGYANELAPWHETSLPLAVIDLEEILEDAQPLHRILPDDRNGLLAGACSQAALPIRREGRTIGIILLESTKTNFVNEDMLGFLERLSDHAAISIANAQLYAAVQAANVAKSEFVSFVAHELKNPMTSIKGYTELVAAGAVGPVTEPQANFLATIRSNIDRMNILISDLNDHSKIEAGRMRLEFQAIPLAEVVDEALRSLRKQVEEKSQVVTVEIPGDLPPTWSDRDRLMQVLVNLVSNANKYTDKSGTIYVGAECCENRWDPQGAAEVIHIWVKDSGIGIASEDQERIFQKFFRSEDPKTREAPGTGLGLNITRSLVEMQGGHIWFESEFRKGTTFHFTVPVAQQ